MSKKKKSKKLKSTAIRINSDFVSKLFVKFLIMDIFIIILSVGYWCANEEKQYFGKVVINATRSFEFTSDREIVYNCTSEGNIMSQDASEFLIMVRNILGCIFILEGIMVFKEILFGTARIRKNLNFLNDIGESAERLSKMNFDESKVQNLQEAISKISPTRNNDKIHIEDKELSGLEEAINNLLERMRESYRQQARFVSDASHELRTPISVIQGYVNMLDRWGKEDEKILNESIEAIKSESESMKILIEQLLFLARGTNGTTKINFKEFLLSDMMKEVFEESKMIDNDHVYIIKNKEDQSVYADESLLKETARILIENAKKYTKKGEVIKLDYGTDVDNQIFFSIQDNGIGMEEKDIPHIFERFFRADTSRVRKTGGTGLGLSIAKWIIDNHGGYFKVLSRKDIGTRITVVIPKSQSL